MTNRSTFYAHFEDKYSLLNAFILDLKNELEKELSKNESFTNTKEYYMEMVRLLFNHIELHKEMYLTLMLNNKNSIAMDMIYSTLLENVTAKMSKEQENGALIPIDFISQFYLGALFQIGIKWIQTKNYYSKDEILHYLDLLLPNDIIAIS